MVLIVRHIDGWGDAFLIEQSTDGADCVFDHAVGAVENGCGLAAQVHVHFRRLSLHNLCGPRFRPQLRMTHPQAILIFFKSSTSRWLMRASVSGLCVWQPVYQTAIGEYNTHPTAPGGLTVPKIGGH